MWTSTFAKQLSYTLLASGSSFPRIFKTTHKAKELIKPKHSRFSSHLSSSPYLTVNILCHKHNSDLLSEALLCFGASSTTIDEKYKDESSNEICINTIFPEGHNVSISISQAADSIGLEEVPIYEVSVGEQCDWVLKTQESFNPVEITRGLWIVPEWREPPDVRATNVILNPGLAFGTGEHPTTKLCLLLLRGSIKGGERFLDYGTGSGVLSIAALKLGCSLSVGIDIDPQAILSARQNAALNDIAPERFQLRVVPEKPSSDVAIQETENYDVVVANILLNPLLDLAESIVSYAKPGAIVGLSGILTEQVQYIKERYSELLEDMSVTEMDDWACIRGTKK